MEKVLLVKTFSAREKNSVAADIEEMKGLITTAGGEIYDVITKKKDLISPAFYIGKGKAEEIALDYGKEVDLVVFDSELKPVQVRNLESAIGVRVIDRTQLILDIFAQRARSAEGKLQVEYAQLSYILPRLTGMGIAMSRLGGGIGTRGPGETKLETDRRKIRQRLQRIKKELAEIKQIRGQQRERRKSVPVPLCAIVGYTNAGKTMLLNKLTNAGMLSEDKLFATLDSKIKHYKLPGGYGVLFSDTVGFIKNLPTHLVAAFRGTLEEAAEADIIIHVVDFSDPMKDDHIKVVQDILKSIGVTEDKKVVEVYNKIDLFDEERRRLVFAHVPNRYYISAATGEGLDRLVQGLEDIVAERFRTETVLIPAGRQELIPMFYEEGMVLEREDTAEGVRLGVRATEKTISRFKKLLEGKKIK